MRNRTEEIARARKSRTQGCSIVRLWSSVSRTAAHVCYQELGYTQIKTQHSFVKSLDLADDPVAFVSRLKRRRGKGICVMGGGQLGHTLLAGGVVDEIGVNIHPVLLGGGVPLFHGLPHQIDLELLRARRLKNGCIYLLYRVKRRRSRASAERAALPIGKGQTV